MIIQCLKNYKIYREKILAYAKVVNITVEFKEENSDGVYIPSKSKVRIDDALEEAEEISTLLHELGHALDDKLDSTNFSKSIERAYYQVYKGKPSKIQLDKVIECEKKAWDLGRVIAKKLRINLGKWYNYQESQALKDYRETETK